MTHFDVLFMHSIDGFAYYEEWQHVMKKVDDEAKALLRQYGDVLKKREDVCKVAKINCFDSCNEMCEMYVLFYCLWSKLLFYVSLD